MTGDAITIVGQGYVGLPLAQAAVNTGRKVWGFDVSQGLVAQLNSGTSHIDDLSNEDVRRMREQGFEATCDASCMRESSVIVVCVPTPLGEGGSPDLSMVQSAMSTIANNLSQDALVILESTTYPGTTDMLCQPLLETESGMTCGSDFYLAFSPERVDPGRTDYGITNTPKLVGGVTPEATDRAAGFYASFIDTVVPVKSSREAETAKLLENTFRHVNIALVNEMAKFCNDLDIDIWEVIRGAATKPFGFMKFTPGPGVGGHCIPIDPNYLSYEVRRRLGYPFRFVELAQEINNSMPKYVVTRIVRLLNEQAKAVNGANVLLLGVTYKADIADQRESPAVPLANDLVALGAKLKFHDPYVKRWRLGTCALNVEPDLEAALASADLVVILQNHASYDLDAVVGAGTPVLDTRGGAPDPAHRL
ncbi:MAG: nucleotide sugar dehydrogenase [Gulosibacter sp.]|uniref:nucleotide sugar dehydrogenase n=1 Tax=Gulosibacter sp. TaxID=2817531 RepID=UPI003F8F69C8